MRRPAARLRTVSEGPERGPKGLVMSG
jgi:hypothetical protein